MAIDTNYIQQSAKSLADYEVYRASSQLSRNEAKYKAQLNALTALDTAIKAMTASLKGLKGSTGSMLVNKATFSKEGMASATVGAKAVEGSYDFFVKQLASKHQLAVGGLGGATPIDTTGALTLEQDGNSFTIDLSTVDTDGDGQNSPEELAAAINGAADNTGVKATLVRSGGEVTFVLSSEKTGVAGEITMTPPAGGALAGAPVSELSRAQDAIIMFGGEGGVEMTSSSNTFDNIIDGVSMTFIKKHETGESPLTVDIKRDNAETTAKAQAFLTAINAMLSTFDTLTATGGTDASRGALAGDSSIRSIENMLNSVLRAEVGGVRLMDFGIVSDSKGKLTIDSRRFEKALEANPEGFDKLFNDRGALLDTLDKNMQQYTSGTNGVMKNRKETLNLQLAKVAKQGVDLEKQWDSHYARYLRQFTNMAQIQESMANTAGLFGLYR